MNINEIRSRYLEFFKNRGHAVIPSASLVPHNDPTTLFTGSGMQPLLPYLLGQPHPKGARLVNSQKSFRAEDIDEVGDNRHTTFFEMLGNWSLGDYFKKEQLPWFFEFLTDVVGIDANKLYVTTFIGDESKGIPRDTESAEIWQELFASKGIAAATVEVGSEADGYRLGMRGGRIFYYDAKKNWWSRAGVPENMPPGEPGGPDSEVFYDFGTPHDIQYGDECHPNCDCGRFLEIANSVFMQYISAKGGSASGGKQFQLLPKASVDFGAGLERIAAASMGVPDIFAIDVFDEIINLLAHFSVKSYADSRYQRSFRIIADHMRAATMILGDGVRPGNTDRGYVLRRLVRRAAQHAMKLEMPQDQGSESILNRCASIVIEKYKNAYPELAGEEAFQNITGEIWQEEKQFAQTLVRGMREFEKMSADNRISGDEAFTLFTTYGFPYEMTLEISAERGIEVDEEQFKKLMKEHQLLSRVGSAQKFAGGLADHSEATVRLHTAHHLLLAALQKVLGSHVHQRGSNITQERLRLDFSHGQKMTKDEIAAIERLVNEKIVAQLPVIRTVMKKEEAERLGAEKEFGAKYADEVSVYSIGPEGATQANPQFDEVFSIEFCGGPHVENTGELAGVRDPDGCIRKDSVKILKEEAVASGIRRIKATLQ